MYVASIKVAGFVSSSLTSLDSLFSLSTSQLQTRVDTGGPYVLFVFLTSNVNSVTQ